MKTVTIYNLTQDSEFNTEDMFTEDKLNNFKFTSLGELDRRKLGFVPNTISGMFVDKISVEGYSYHLATIREQKKVPEKYLVEDYISAKKIQYFADTGKPAEKSLVKEWKEEGTDLILKSTFPKQPKDFMIAIRNDGLVIAEAKGKLVEDLFALVRKALGTFPVVPKETDIAVTDLMDKMVETSASDVFTLGDKVTLEDEEGLVHSLSKGSVYSSDAAAYVKQGMFVTSLELEYDGTTTFILKDDLVLDSIRFSKEFVEDEGSEAGTVLLKIAEVDKIINEVLNRLKG